MIATAHRPLRLVGLLLATLLAGGLAGCGPRRAAAEAEALPGRSMIETELFFGLSIPGGGEVGEAQWAGYLEEVLTRAFPEGLTVVDASGQWRDARGDLVREASKVVRVVHEDAPEAWMGLEKAVEAYKKRFRQESVLRVSRPVRATF